MHQFFQLLLSASMLVALPSNDESNTYQCGLSVAGQLELADQKGPLFSSHGLIFKSLEAQGGQRLLVFSAGNGLYSIPLDKVGVNRLRFSVGHSKTYFLSYLHDPVSNSRVFDFTVQRPPVGKEEIDFYEVTARRADHLLPHLEYGIFETAQVILEGLTEGRLARNQVQPKTSAHCQNKNVKRSLELVAMMVIGPASEDKGRKPASLN